MTEQTTPFEADEVSRPGPARRRLFTLLSEMQPILLLLLVLSAALTFVTAEQGRDWPRSFVIAAPAAFLLFLVLFAVYRLQGVRAGRYAAGKAFVQITLGALVFTLLLPGSMKAYRSRARATDPMVRLLEHKDPEMRVLGLQLLRARALSAKYAEQIERLLEDPDPNVRNEAATTNLWGAPACIQPAKPLPAGKNQ